MTAVESQRIDLTEPGSHLRYVEVRTPGGIVRVNTNLVDTRTGRPVVTVEVEPNSTYLPRTAAEDWHVSWREIGSRLDVTLTREDGPH